MQQALLREKLSYHPRLLMGQNQRGLYYSAVDGQQQQMGTKHTPNSPTVLRQGAAGEND